MIVKEQVKSIVARQMGKEVSRLGYHLLILFFLLIFLAFSKSLFFDKFFYALSASSFLSLELNYTPPYIQTGEGSGVVTNRDYSSRPQSMKSISSSGNHLCPTVRYTSLHYLCQWILFNGATLLIVYGFIPQMQS